MQERSKLIRAFLLTSFKLANIFSSAMEEEYYDDGNISVVLREAIGVFPNLINPYDEESDHSYKAVRTCPQKSDG